MLTIPTTSSSWLMSTATIHQTNWNKLKRSWVQARDKAAAEGLASGLTSFEHAHWDWRNKVHSVEAGRHMLVAVECQGEVQGLMAVLRLPVPSRRSADPLFYVDYLESAPWNLKLLSVSPRFMGVGTVLMAEAVRLSLRCGPGRPRWPAFAPPGRRILQVSVWNDWVRSGLKLF